MRTAKYYLAKAEQCRRLAATIVPGADPAITALAALAREFDARAMAAARRETEAMMAQLAKPVAPSDGSGGG